MVFVGMRNHHRLHHALSFAEVGDVGDDDVDPERRFVGKCEPAIDEDDLIVVLVDVEVLPDLADEPQCSGHTAAARIQTRCPHW